MNPFPIVAVASSAGDLGAVVELLSALPAKWGEVFIIVQHFDPGRRDMLLHDALAKATSHPVLLAHDGVVPERGNVYVMRANVALAIIGGRVSVSPGASPREGPADTLFTSLAAERGAGAIGVVLSGGAPTVPWAYKPSRKSGAPHLRNTRDLRAFPACPSAPSKLDEWDPCCVRTRLLTS